MPKSKIDTLPEWAEPLLFTRPLSIDSEMPIEDAADAIRAMHAAEPGFFSTRQRTRQGSITVMDDHILGFEVKSLRVSRGRYTSAYAVGTLVSGPGDTTLLRGRIRVGVGYMVVVVLLPLLVIVPLVMTILQFLIMPLWFLLVWIGTIVLSFAFSGWTIYSDYRLLGADLENALYLPGKRKKRGEV